MLPSLFLPNWLLSLYDNIGQFHVWCSSGHGVSGHGHAGDTPDVPRGTSVSVWLLTTHTRELNECVAVQPSSGSRLSLPLLYVVCTYVCTYLHTYIALKPAREQTVIVYLDVHSQQLSSALFSTFACFISLKTFISLTSPRSMPFKGSSCLTSHKFKKTVCFCIN